MALATFKDLCLDARDPVRLGEFWAAALDLELQRHEDGDVHLSGPTPAHTVWVNRVPEPRTAKHRVHLDVNTASVAALERLGATVLDADSFRWTLMADPEGGEFCAFVREGEIERRLYEIGMDATGSVEDAHRVAAWWGELTGGRVVDERGFSSVRDVPGAPFDSIDVAPVPEPKTAKNRVHLDLVAPDLAAVVATGATVLRPADDRVPWTVLADPVGNELCLFPADPGA